MLALGLRHPIVVLVMACGVFAGAYFTIGTLPSEFVPSQDQSRLQVRMTGQVGSDLAEMDRLVRRAEAFAGSIPEVERVFGIVGGFGGGGVKSGMFFVKLKDPKAASARRTTLPQCCAKSSQYPGLRAVVQDSRNRALRRSAASDRVLRARPGVGAAGRVE